MKQTKVEQPRGYVQVSKEDRTKFCLVFQEFSCSYTADEFRRAEAKGTETVCLLGKLPRPNIGQTKYLIEMIENAKQLQTIFQEVNGHRCRPAIELWPHPKAPITYPVCNLPGDKKFPSVIFFGHLKHLNKGPIIPAGTPRALGINVNNLFAAAALGMLTTRQEIAIAPDDYPGMLGVRVEEHDHLIRGIIELNKRHDEERAHQIKMLSQAHEFVCTV